MNLIARNPYDDSVVCERPYDTPSSLQETIEAARNAQLQWREVDVFQRRDCVIEALDWFESNQHDVATDITKQMGKPISEALGEVTTMLNRARYMASIAEESLASEVFPTNNGISMATHHVPIGTVLDIAAWNYPLLIAVNVVVPALIAGNAVILKHSERTPLCGEHFLRALKDVGPKGIFGNIMVTHEGVAELMGDSRIDHVSFTGSVDGGRAVRQAAADRFIDVGLELGGKDPAYVAADVDVEYAAANLVEGACYNAGQSCCAVERVYVHADIHAEFITRAQTHMKQLKLGNPLEETTDIGPMANPRQLGVLAEHVRDAVSRGASLLCGGSSPDERSFEPTLLDGCPNDSLVMQEESFGPILPVLSVGSDQEALEHFNDTRFGLTASIWTRDPERAQWFAQHHDTGTVFQNRCDFADPALPWTGCRDTGNGNSLSRHGYLQLTRCTSTHFREHPVTQE